MISVKELMVVRNEKLNSALTRSEKFLYKYNFIFPLSNLKGVYVFSPLGMLYINRIIQLIRNKLILINIPELILPTISHISLWKYRTNDEKFTCEDVIISPTSEETVISLWENNFPYQSFFQISKNFRNELRPNFSLIRTKEFIMQDGYAKFDTFEKAEEFYLKIIDLYKDFFNEIKIKYHTMDVYEDGKTLQFYVETNTELKSQVVNNKNTVEIAHIFLYEPTVFNVFIVSYGIGITRLLQTFIELKMNDKGDIDFDLLNPFSSFKIIDYNNQLTDEEKLNDVFYDNRNISKSQKLFDIKTLGIKYEKK